MMIRRPLLLAGLCSYALACAADSVVDSEAVGEKIEPRSSTLPMNTFTAIPIGRDNPPTADRTPYCWYAFNGDRKILESFQHQPDAAARYARQQLAKQSVVLSKLGTITMAAVKAKVQALKAKLQSDDGVKIKAMQTLEAATNETYPLVSANAATVGAIEDFFAGLEENSATRARLMQAKFCEEALQKAFQRSGVQSEETLTKP